MKNCGTEPETRFLFRGTSDHKAAKAIFHQNFYPHLHGKNGTRYGQGAYFARDASYSSRYSEPEGTDKTCIMFLANVIVGTYTKGKSNLRRPPTLDKDSLDLYDSCVDNVQDPSVFVIFERDQVYPSYKIVFTKV